MPSAALRLRSRVRARAARVRAQQLLGWQRSLIDHEHPALVRLPIVEIVSADDEIAEAIPIDVSARHGGAETRANLVRLEDERSGELIDVGARHSEIHDRG